MELVTLKNGLKIALKQNPLSRSCAIDLFIGCGSGYENAQNSGIAHFLEHILFKGTKNYTNRKLSEKMDRLGGQFNAYTAKEYTCLFCNVTTYDVAEALELILEMAVYPTVDKEELETERGVILEEINMYEDSPEDCAADGISEIIFKDNGLKNNILGTANTVKSFTAKDLHNHHQKYYVPERMVLSLCGNFQKEKVIAIAEKYLGGIKNTGFNNGIQKIDFGCGIKLRKKDFEQSQIIIASKGFRAGDQSRYAASAFSAILGGSASSRLNMHIREKLGLAYSVYSYPLSYISAGAFLICAGTSHNNHLRVIEESLKIADEVVSSITENELQRVKSQYRASSILGSESQAAIAAAMGRELLLFGKYTDIDEVIKDINALSLDDVLAAGTAMWQKERLALCVVGKPENLKKYQSLGFKA